MQQALGDSPGKVFTPPEVAEMVMVGRASRKPSGPGTEPPWLGSATDRAGPASPSRPASSGRRDGPSPGQPPGPAPIQGAGPARPPAAAPPPAPREVPEDLSGLY
jgi:hypothetical protein